MTEGDVVLIGRILFPEQKCAVSCLEKAMFTHPKWKHYNDKESDLLNKCKINNRNIRE